MRAVGRRASEPVVCPAWRRSRWAPSGRNRRAVPAPWSRSGPGCPRGCGPVVGAGSGRIRGRHGRCLSGLGAQADGRRTGPGRVPCGDLPPGPYPALAPGRRGCGAAGPVAGPVGGVHHAGTDRPPDTGWRGRRLSGLGTQADSRCTEPDRVPCDDPPPEPHPAHAPGRRRCAAGEPVADRLCGVHDAGTDRRPDTAWHGRRLPGLGTQADSRYAEPDQVPCDDPPPEPHPALAPDRRGCAAAGPVAEPASKVRNAAFPVPSAGPRPCRGRARTASARRPDPCGRVPGDGGAREGQAVSSAAAPPVYGRGARRRSGRPRWRRPRWPPRRASRPPTRRVSRPGSRARCRGSGG